MIARTSKAELRRRLSPVEEKVIAPFMKATEIQDSSIYWLPVSQYPMRPDQREWLREFHRCLAAHLRSRKSLREELFLRFKSIYPNLHDLFSKTSIDFAPMVGGGIAPGSSLPERVNFEALKSQVEEASKKGTTIDIQRWMPDLTYWFAKKRPEEQRECFLGYNGLVTVYLPPDEQTTPPKIEIPRFVATAPGFKEFGQERINAEMEFAYSLRDRFLAKSKEVFGAAYRDDPSYKGLLFVVPLFTAQVLVTAQAEQRAEWFNVFEGYMTESAADRGVLLAMKEPEFDGELAEILHGMGDAGFVYRS